MQSKPAMPDLTQAHIVAILMTIVGAVAAVLNAFGVYHLSDQQMAALGMAVAALVVSGGFLVSADAYLRGKRNQHAAAVAVATVAKEPQQAAPAVEPVPPVPPARIRRPRAPKV